MTDDDEAPQAPPEHLAHLRGMDLVRRTLEEARGAARSQGKDVGRGRTTPARRVAGQGRRRSWSGPGPDVRDPQRLGAATADLTKNRGWGGRVAEGTVFGQWSQVVGDQIAEHASPTVLRDGVLVVVAMVDDSQVGQGTGRSKKEAEQAAARQALDDMEKG